MRERELAMVDTAASATATAAGQQDTGRKNVKFSSPNTKKAAASQRIGVTTTGGGSSGGGGRPR
jgi:hypothetical protein